MAIVHTPSTILQELADCLASEPSREDLLNFHPSEPVQQRARELLAKQQDHQLTFDEEREVTQFEQVELLMRLVKAKLHARLPS